MADQPEPVIELLQADVPRCAQASRTPSVAKVDWRIDRGSFWAVGAFAGGGKTDLLLTAAGLQRPLSGDLLLFGKPVSRMSEAELVASRLKVAMIFSDGRLFPHLTVSENVALPLQYHALGEAPAIQERVRLALEISHLTSLAGRLPRQIPRALHQRVALARALALSPEVLLVDNPLVGVDQRNARWWIDFLCAASAGDPRLGGALTVVVAADDLRPWTAAAREFGVLREHRFEPVGGREEVRRTSQKIVRELLERAFEES